MEEKKWKKFLKEGKELVTESTNFLNAEHDHSTESKVQLTLDRKIDAMTAWYRLETDGWFRRYMNPGKGYGLMLRSFKVSGGGKPHPIAKRLLEFPVLITYLPIEFDDPDDDIPTNYKKLKGKLVINTDNTDVVSSEVERFVNTQIRSKTYVP
jgi:hypothetical protein